jgi:hypothetical protein
MWKRTFSHISSLAHQRMDLMMKNKDWYSPIPKYVKGLGQRYLPILLRSKQIPPYEIVSSKLLHTDQVKENIVKSILKLQHPYFLQGDLNKRFLDPAEIETAIAQLNEKGFLYGFMLAS